MPTNTAILDAGTPALGNPPDPADQDALQYGNALAGVWGSEATPSGYGSYLRGRIPTLFGSLNITGNSIELAQPGAVIAVVVTTGGDPGAKILRPFGTPTTSEVLVEYNNDGTPTLTFTAATRCYVHQMLIPAEFVAHLDAEASPP